MPENQFLNFPWGYDPRSDVPIQYATTLLKYFAPVGFITDQNLSMMMQSTKGELIANLKKEGKGKNNFECIHTGSTAEGLAVPDFLIMGKGKMQKIAMRDIDEMLVEENWFEADVPAYAKEIYGQGEPFQLEATSNSSENYAFLKVTDKFKIACELEGNPLKIVYLSNTFVVEMLEASWDLIGNWSRFHIREQHGPSVAHVHNTYLSPGREADHVSAIHFPKWPKIAEEWQVRKRISNWPSKSQIDDIVKKGHHMAPVGWSHSPTVDKEWRYSFSIAEMMLAQSISDEQRQVYIILKMLHYFYFSEPNCLPTYCLKTLFFWSLEKIHQKHFTQNNIAMMLYYILDEICLALSKRSLPHYFISQVNLLKHCPLQHMRTLCKNVKKVRRNIVKCLINVDNKILFFALSHRMKLDKAFANLIETNSSMQTPKDIFKNYLYTGVSRILLSYMDMIISLQNLPEKIKDLKPVQMNVWVKLCQQALADMRLCCPKMIELPTVSSWVYFLSLHKHNPESIAAILLHMCAMDHQVELQKENTYQMSCPKFSNLKDELYKAIRNVISLYDSANVKHQETISLLKNVQSNIELLPLPEKDKFNNKLLYDKLYHKNVDLVKSILVK